MNARPQRQGKARFSGARPDFPARAGLPSPSQKHINGICRSFQNTIPLAPALPLPILLLLIFTALHFLILMIPTLRLPPPSSFRPRALEAAERGGEGKRKSGRRTLVFRGMGRGRRAEGVKMRGGRGGGGHVDRTATFDQHAAAHVDRTWRFDQHMLIEPRGSINMCWSNGQVRSTWAAAC